MEELEESELGTKEFWDQRYKEEIRNFKSHGDVGEVWFGEDIVDRIIRWLNKHLPDKAVPILDVGCGNGMLLVELYAEGYTNLKGVDYSPDAVNLAQIIASEKDFSITYETLNILQTNSDLNGFKVVLDKGTYDAISLSCDAKSNRNTYIKNMKQFLKDDGILIITSCNWTKDELCAQFAHEFVLKDVIPTPQFKFGGKVGNVVSSVVFTKKNSVE